MHDHAADARRGTRRVGVLAESTSGSKNGLSSSRSRRDRGRPAGRDELVIVEDLRCLPTNIKQKRVHTDQARHCPGLSSSTMSKN